MHTADLLEQALQAAAKLGYGVRQEWLGGSGGGDCEIKGQKWIFVDLALSLPDQLEQVAEVLRREDGTAISVQPGDLGRLVERRKAA
ncbi:MAG TPA: hypothetical protein VGX78_15790 [Pirellulales bacterium]|jgi:hypothetical protein|nr:hypothetical protein [Pirellulales bacterium]